METKITSTKTKTKTAPKGFDIYAGQESARQRIDARLDYTIGVLSKHGIQARKRTHAYRNGSLDSEIVIDVTRGVSATDIAKSVEEAFGTTNLKEIWFSVGASFAVKDVEQAEYASGVFDRRRGLDTVQTYYRKMYGKDERKRTSIFGDSFGRLEHIVIPKMEDKYHRKAQTVFIRLHWNPSNEKPNR